MQLLKQAESVFVSGVHQLGLKNSRSVCIPTALQKTIRIGGSLEIMRLLSAIEKNSSNPEITGTTVADPLHGSKYPIPFGNLSVMV